MSEPATGVAPDRMAHLVEHLGHVGAVPGGGVSRFTYDPAWSAATDLVAGWMRDAGLAVRRDQVGNVVGRLEGTGGGNRTILTGSHIDTVLSGGRYDGALGIVAGLAALEYLLSRYGPPARALELVALCEEEGSRFHSNFLGSRAMLGLLDPSEVRALRDPGGVSLAEAMHGVGLDPDAATAARRDDVEAFVELHIEQGRTLYDEGVAIGVVESITGLGWLEVVVDGRTDHAGTTSMAARRDAMTAAAAMVTALTDLVEREGHPAVLTCGRWDVEPGGPNIVPGRVAFSVDVRHPDEITLRRLVGTAIATCQEIAADRGLTVCAEEAKYAPPAPLDTDLRDRIGRAADTCGASTMPLPSGAGHDSQMWSPLVPTGMLFVPSVDGRSHCPEEYTSPEDCARGATVLATLLHDLAY